MKQSRLPQELIEVGIQYGFSGRRVYFPKQKMHTFVTPHVPAVLREAACEYTGIYLSYPEIRGGLGKDQPVDADDFARYHGVPSEIIREIIDLARGSVVSCPWKSS